MSPEQSKPTPANKAEHETPFETKVGDVLFVSRNLKDEKGAPLLDAEGKRMTALEDGWEVIDLKGIHPGSHKEGIMLRNLDNPNELKFYSLSQLEGFQAQAEADIMAKASSAASGMLGEVDHHSAEIAEEEPRLTEEQARENGDAALDAAGVEDPSETPSRWSEEAAKQEEPRYTREKPYIFGLEDVTFTTSVTIDGHEVRAMTKGMFTDEKGHRQMILGPMSAEDAQLFEGKMITKPESEIFRARPAMTIPEYRSSQADIAKNHPIDDDESGYAKPMAEIRKIMEQRAQAPIEPAAAPEAPEQETELQMNERFLAETQTELRGLYAQHRTLDPKSNEAASIENQIRHAKEDAGKFAKKVAHLKGGNWT